VGGRDIELKEDSRGEEKEGREKDGGLDGILTVLKYSIDLMIFPFSSGINNIPKASLALPSAS